MILEIFTVAEASKLLYAAQVAIGSRRARQQAARAQGALATPTPTPSLVECAIPPATPNPAISANSASPAQAPPPPTPLPLPAKKQPASAPAARHLSLQEIETLLGQVDSSTSPIDQSGREEINGCPIQAPLG
jgi:hypothetical protein